MRKKSDFWHRVIRNERGTVLAFVAVSLVGLLGIAGLALDSGRAYVKRSELSRAVDAAALGGAAALRQSQTAAEQRIITLAKANGVDPALLNYSFGVNAAGENTVSVSANETVPTTFMRVLGRDQVGVVAAAEATVPPLDLVLVLDQSGSIAREGAWDDLQNAAKDFIDNFNESIDQVGLVSFQVRAGQHVPLGQPFRANIRAAIDAMTSVGDTNTGEGLRVGKETLDTGPTRNHSVQVVVFFTDGRPTAFRGMVGGQDRAMAVSTRITGNVRGYFDNPDALPLNQIARADGCQGVPSCFGMNENAVRTRGKANGLQEANRTRGSNIYLFTIGLGNPNNPDPILTPDMDYLRELANEDGVTDPSQPQGSAYFAPTAAELDDVFDAVAQDILVRLSK
jgi:Flp pilus assembly protein TadG